MEFRSRVSLATGSLALLLALVTGLTSIIITIAIVKNPLHLTLKPLDRIVHIMIALSFFAGTMFLPFFGITEILRGADVGGLDLEILSHIVSVVADFLIGSKLSIHFLFQFERYIAYVHPHFHRGRMTKRCLTLVAFFLVSFALLLSLLSLAGKHEQVHRLVFIHVFASSTWLALIPLIWMTYRNLKYRKTKVGPDEMSDLPHLRQRIEMENARNALGARKFLLKFAMWYSPIFLSTLPWYIVKFICTIKKGLLENNMGFFWKKLFIPLALVTDPIVPIFMIINDYSRTVKFIFRTS